MADIAIIGVGLVGSALAERFQKAGLTIVGFDRRPEAIADFAAAASAASAAAQARFIVLSLPDSDAVEAVIGEIESTLAGRIVIDTTTGDPERTASLGKRLDGMGIPYVDATIVGSSKQVGEGNVTLLVGGKPEAVRACEPLFRRFATNWFHVGPWGSGARMKLVVNLVLGLNRAVLAEGLAFAQACEVDPALALDVLRAGAGYSRVMDAKGPKMIAGDFSPEARLSQHHKDVLLILQAADQRGIDLPLSGVHERLLAELEGQGLGDCDNSAIIRAFAK